MSVVGRRFLRSYQPVVLCVFFILHHIHPLDGETVMGRETADFDFDGRPGSVHEFKVAVLGNKEECFYQLVAHGSFFFVNFNVLRGGDKLVDFYVKDHTGRILYQLTSKSDGNYQLTDSPMGVIEVCIDNIYSRFGYKLVHLSIMSVVVSQWEEFRKEVEEMHLVTANFTASLTSVQSSVTAMLQSVIQANLPYNAWLYESIHRFLAVKDYYLVMGNNLYVFLWSLGQCILIVVASLVQVFSLRRLFKTSNVTPTTAKPRA